MKNSEAKKQKTAFARSLKVKNMPNFQEFDRKMIALCYVIYLNATDTEY